MIVPALSVECLFASHECGLVCSVDYDRGISWNSSSIQPFHIDSETSGPLIPDHVTPVICQQLNSWSLDSLVVHKFALTFSIPPPPSPAIICSAPAQAQDSTAKSTSMKLGANPGLIADDYTDPTPETQLTFDTNPQAPNPYLGVLPSQLPPPRM